VHQALVGDVTREVGLAGARGGIDEREREREQVALRAAACLVATP